MLLILAWASLPLWPLTVAAVWLWDDKVTTVCFGTEALATFAALVLFFAGRVDEMVKARTAELSEQKQVLIMAVDRLSDAVTQPQPALRVVSS